MSQIAMTVLADLEHEMAGARRMLERYPTGQDSFTPHEKSWPMQTLATHLATVPMFGTITLTTTEIDFAKPMPPMPAPASDAAGMVAIFDAQWAEFKTLLHGTTDAALGESWTMRSGAHVISTMPRIAVLRSMVANHLIHHRAQLTLYYRLVGVPVPGLYGPSADEQ